LNRHSKVLKIQKKKFMGGNIIAVMPRLRMGGAIPLLPLYAFVARYGMKQNE
jgi:hypothetical protein